METTELILSPVTLDKPSRRIELEADIESARQSMIKAGAALQEIRDSGLYKPEFASFEQYCLIRWGFKRAHAYRLMGAGVIAKELSPIGVITKESHARALAKVPREERKTIFKSASEKAKSAGRDITAKDISNAVQPSSATIIVAAKSDSTEDQLRALWGKATPTERESFLAWAKAQSLAENQDRFRCDSCDATFQDCDEAVTLYECNNCGTRFTQQTSPNGNHQCPDCDKFGAKISEHGCPECNDGELKAIGSD